MRRSLAPYLAVAGLAAGLLLSARLLAQQPPAPAALPAPVKVAVVDVQRAVMETEDGLRAQATLKKYFDRRQGDLNAKQEDLLRRKDEIQAQSKVLSKDALARAMEEWQRQMNELQQVFMDYNKELQKRQGEVTAPIYARVSGLLRKIAKRDGYDLVLERQAVPYVRTELDLTDTLITMYNSGEDGAGDAPREAPNGSAAPPSPAAPPSSAAPKAPLALSAGVRLPASVTVGELADEHGGVVDEGARDRVVHRVVSATGPRDGASLVPILRADAIDSATAGDALLLVDEALASRVPSGRRWVHRHPAWALAGVLARCEATPSHDERSRAVIDPKADVAATARVGAFAIVRAGAVIGEGCVIEPHAVVFGGVSLGARVVVGASAVIGRPGFGWATGPTGEVRHVPQLGGVIIDDDVSIGAHATVDAGTLGPTRIGRGAKLDAHVHVGHNTSIGPGAMIAAQSGFAGSSRIGAAVLVGGQVGVADHVVVGDGARLAAKAGVISDVPPGATFAGYPAVDRLRWLRGMARLLGRSKSRQ